MGIIAVRTEVLAQILRVRRWARRLGKAKNARDVEKVLKRYCQVQKIQYIELGNLNESQAALVQCVTCRRVEDKSNVVRFDSVICPIDGLKREAFTLRRCTYHKKDSIERVERALV